MRRHVALLAFTLMLAGSTSALANDANGTTVPAPAPAVTADAAVATAEAAAVPAWIVDRTERRPTMLSALYGTYGTLQILDLVSTRKAIAVGGHEVNPVMGSGGTTRMLIVKSAGAAMSIYMAERMWKKNRVAAIVTMVAMNGVSAAVVAHNARIAGR